MEAVLAIQASGAALMRTRPWLVALSAGALVQSVKFLAHFVSTRHVDFKVLVRTGGMPSSHSASVSALATCVGMNEGFASTLFGVTLFFSLIVMYDAAGLRRAAGKQAEILNRLVDHHYPRRGIREERLLELLGHTPLEVLVGSILGVAYALVWY